MSNKRRNSFSQDGDQKRMAVEGAPPTDETGDDSGKIVVPTPVPVSSNSKEVDPSSYVHLRILIQARDAVHIIGKGGSTIARIKDACGIRLNVSDNVAGARERIVHLKGSAEHVAKAAGLVVRVMHEEPFDAPSGPEARALTMQLLMPHVMMGALIGKKGTKFREIEEASAAKLKAQEHILPYSTERVLTIHGVADAIHIAVYYIAMTYLSHQDTLDKTRQQQYDPAASRQAMMPPMPGYYHPGPLLGGPIMGGHSLPGMANAGGNPPTNTGPGGPQGPASSAAISAAASVAAGQARDMYGAPPGGVGAMVGMPGANSLPYGHAMPSYGTRGAVGHLAYPTPGGYDAYGYPPRGAVAQGYGLPPPVSAPIPTSEPVTNPSLQSALAAAQTAPPGQEFEQDVFIPNEVVGPLIGKAGANIKDIRHISGARIKVHDLDPSAAGRRVTINGLPEAHTHAVYLVNAKITMGRRNTRI